MGFLLPHRVWRDTIIGAANNEAQKKDSHQMVWIVQREMGEVISQPSIVYGLPALSRGDGVHRSETGYKIYLKNLAQGLKSFVEFSYGEARG